MDNNKKNLKTFVYGLVAGAIIYSAGQKSKGTVNIYMEHQKEEK